jgi:predicted dienelactone hydrolase
MNNRHFGRSASVVVNIFTALFPGTLGEEQPMQEIYVVSSAIGELRTKIASQITPVIQKAHTDIDGTSVGFPGFGGLGALVFGGAYASAQAYSRQVLQDALTTLTAWDTELGQVEKNWRSAEDKSTVVYQ